MATIEEKYNHAYKTCGDIHEHIPVLYNYSCKCNHIIEFGVRAVVSTWAFLHARPKTLISVDLNRHRNVQDAIDLAQKEGLDFRFVEANVLEIGIDSTDLLFIDTYHTYKQLNAELNKHHGKVGKFIIVHDTEAFKHRGEDGDQARGLWDALTEFTARTKWHILEHLSNNNGLTVLTI